MQGVADDQGAGQAVAVHQELCLGHVLLRGAGAGFDQHGVCGHAGADRGGGGDL